MRIRQKKRKLQKKWNLRKRQRNTVNESSENEQEDGHSKAKVSHTGSPQQIPIRKKKARKVTSKQEKINEHLPKETTPLHEPKVKLKQTKLNFQNRESTNSNEMSLFESKFHNRFNKWSKSAVNLITSTPVCPKVNTERLSITLSPTLEKNNITSIESIKHTTNKLDKHKSSNQLGNKTPEKKTLKKTD